MKMSKMYMPTLREIPSEAEIPSHQLLLRAGMIRRLVSGIYSYLPLGYRAIKKVDQVVREEMDAHGGQELLMSAVQPRELWEATDRWEGFGPEMFKLTDRHNREFCLGPTHEEYFTNLVKDEVKSYKQLPLNLYQIQTKYRDEKRPRFGLMRAREFIMKDAYSFDIDEVNMKIAYQEMWDAYDAIFTRLKLDYRVVEGDSGAMGGDASHEFVAMSEYGEGLVAYCTECEYAATDEKAKVSYTLKDQDSEDREMEKIYTPGIITIEDLVEFLKEDEIGADRLAKSLVYNACGSPVVVMIPGDRELNETKLCNYLGIASHSLEMADEATIIEVTGAVTGFAGPVGLKKGVRLLVDSRVSQMKNIGVGGNEKDHHIKNVNYGRDYTGEIVEDLLLIHDTDSCPKCGSPIEMARGIEVGNIFQLGTKYSDALGAKFLDQNGREKSFVMGCYGIGVSRSVAAIVEQYHDDKGINWPLVVAPYHVIITIINMKNEDQVALGEKLYDELSAAGVEVMLDNRDERVGVKFNDRDLIGIPIRITVGKKAIDSIVEYSIRSEEEITDVKTDQLKGLIQKQFDKEELVIKLN